MSTATLGGTTCVRVVGGIMPGDVIARVVAGDLPGMTAADYHLAAGEQVRTAASRAWTTLQAAYTGFRDELVALPPDATATALTREKWLQQLLMQLGYGRVPVTAGGHLATGHPSVEPGGGDTREYPISHLWADVPMHLLGWNLDLDRAQRGVAGAARAPQSMVQEFLNRSDDHLWALLSNGRTLRLLRDSSALVGQAYVEFDLAAMFDGDLFSDFVVLFGLCHESRLERQPGPDGEPGGVADRWIERWRSDAIATGTRALAGMRGQVEKALEALGTGFYAHPANTHLRARLESGAITPADYQRALLRLVYRLLFWFVADDRGLLLDPAADPIAVQRYRDYFSSQRLRRIAARRVGTRHDDVWQQINLVLAGLGADTGRPELGLPALGGLFEPGPMDVLTGCRISNIATLDAIRLLSHTTDKTSRRRLAVDFNHLGAEELGGIYEGLLELHPRLDPGQRRFTLEAAAGNERKTSGSYYTPADLIALVLDEALDPVLDDALRADDPEAELLAVTVCDPACGSGHFLVAAAKRIAVRLAQVRSGEAEPTPVQEHAALRDVVTRCIHGVDINPMAAELAKVSLWLEAVDPGKPLAFLDANIRVGNALLGTTPALLAAGVPDDAFKALTGDDKPTVTALKKRNKTERAQYEHQGELFTTDAISVSNTELAARARAIDTAAAGATLADTHLAARRLREYEDSPQRRHAIEVADAWCAAFTQPKTPDTAAIAVTDATLRRLAAEPPPESPAGASEAQGTERRRVPVEGSKPPLAPGTTPVISTSSIDGELRTPRAPASLPLGAPRAPASESKPPPTSTRALVAAEARTHRFFHWHLEFPEIFRVDDSDSDDVTRQGWTGGFTVMVGNPPWERVKLQEKEFFEDVPEIASAPNAAARKRLIKALPETDPALWQSWQRASRSAEATSEFLRTSGRYPLTGAGDVNTYQVFAETFRDLIARDGRCGFITPTGLATDATTAPFIADTLRTKRLAAFYDFENSTPTFEGVHRSFRFAVSAITGGAPVAGARLAFMLHDPAQAPDRRFGLSADEILLLNPNTGTLPVFQSRRDAEITLGIYRRHPILIRDPNPATGDPGSNPWGLSFMTMFHMSNDSHLFRTREDLEALGATFDGWAWSRTDESGETHRWLPLYEAKQLALFDHRAADVYKSESASIRQNQSRSIPATDHDRAARETHGLYWIDGAEVAAAVGESATASNTQFGWRKITSATNERTFIFSQLPLAGAGDSLLVARSEREVILMAALQAQLSSLALDYVARQKLSGVNFQFYVTRQIACPAPETFHATPAWLNHPLLEWVLPHVLELTYTSYRIAGYARDLGDSGEPFRWIPERRFEIRAELDAAMMHVYGLQRDEVEHVLDSFPVLRKYEEAPPDKGGYGEFRTKRLVLDYYDRMAAAANTGKPYQSPIDPPPGDGPRHPPRSES